LVNILALAAGSRHHWHAGSVPPQCGGNHPWLPVNAASLLRRNWRQDAALTGTLEARRHNVEATILVASECSILAAFWEDRRIM
jgi:hypothetical protein